MTNVGLIGLGNAGAALAGPLADQFPVYGFDTNPARRAIVEPLQVHWCASITEVAERAEIVLLNLPTPEISIDVTNQVLAVAEKPTLLIETSTVTPATAIELGQRCASVGVEFVEAAIAGGVAGMAAGKTTFLVGASDRAAKLAEPVLSSMASTIRYIGPVGSGMGAKVIINAVYHAEMVVLLEAFAMAKKLAIPEQTLSEILRSPEGMMRPLTHRIEQRVLKQDFEGGMSVTNARKDSHLAIQTAQELGVPLFAIQASHTPYEIAEALGMGDLDYASLAILWDRWNRDSTP